MGKFTSLRRKMKVHKYLFVSLVFLAVLVFVDDNNLIRRYRHRCEIRDLKTEIAKNQKRYDEATQKLEDLDADSEAMEKIARENFRMHTKNEDVFIFDE